MKNHDSGSLIDQTARILAGPMPRRGALLALGRVLTGGLFAALSIQRADSQTSSKTCGGGGGCGASQKCCETAGIAAFCIDVTRICCANISCSMSEQCCTTGTKAFCAGKNSTCCGKSTCSAGSTCCANKTCCGKNQTCVGGRCQASKA